MVSAESITAHPLLRSAGPAFRSPTPGPELDLIHNYLQYNLPPAPDYRYRQLFLEPRIESGYPDAVLVELDVRRASSWPRARAELSKEDIRLFHFLWSTGVTCIEDIPKGLRRSLNASVNRLVDAHMLTIDGCDFLLPPTSSVSALTRLAAFEAKMDDWRGGLRQAGSNSWFASELYLLVDRIPQRTSEFYSAAEDAGVKILTAEDPIPNRIDTTTRSLLNSYVSWQFHEWTWLSFIGSHAWEKAYLDVN